MATLAIKGHAKRGREVIELLEMLGGINEDEHKGFMTSVYYFINDNYIDWCHECTPESEFICFSLEEFLEKFPYKVGDKVVVTAGKDTFIDVIGEMKWEEKISTILYVPQNIKINVYPEKLQPYKEETMKTHKTQKEVNIYLQDITIKNAQNLLDIEQHLNNDGLELPNNIVINKKGIDVFEFIKWYNKPQYPKTYEECAELLNTFCGSIEGYKGILLSYLEQLLVCRDAYWKIAGEQMGLGKSWEPDYTNPDIDLYVIINIYNRLEKAKYGYGFQQCILTFPTEEMRDAFHESFKELIKQCKELL